jgi:hypothetical protein
MGASVDGLRHADERQPSQRQQAAQDIETAVAADADQAVEIQRVQPFHHLAGTILPAAVRHRKGEGIAAVDAAEDSAASSRSGSSVSAATGRWTRPSVPLRCPMVVQPYP